MRPNIDALRSWKVWQGKSRGKKWKYLDKVGGPYQSIGGALEGTDTGRNSPRKEMSPTERSKERGGEKEVLHVPNRSPKPEPPFPLITAEPHPPEDPPMGKPLRETREERPERQEEESKRQWKRPKEGDEKTNKGCGENGWGI